MSMDALKGYAISGAAIAAGLTLNEWAAVAGILGVAATIIFQWRRDRREATAAKIQAGVRPDRRTEPRRCTDRECPEVPAEERAS